MHGGNYLIADRPCRRSAAVVDPVRAPAPAPVRRGGRPDVSPPGPHHGRPANIQFRSQLVAESWRLDEHEVPRTGLRVRRPYRYARGSDGQELFWIGRQKDPSAAIASPTLRFDFLEG